MTDKQLFYTTAGKCVSSWLEMDGNAGEYTARALYGFLGCGQFLMIEIRSRRGYTEIFGQLLDEDGRGRVEVKKRIAALPLDIGRGERLTHVARGMLFSVLRDNESMLECLVSTVHRRAEKLIAAAG